MSDSRLDSIHLDAQRREEFREARQYLLQARGAVTMQAEALPASSDRGLASGTCIQDVDRPVPLDLRVYVQDKEFVYPLKAGLNTIGRLPDNDVVINDPQVSRRHCAVVVHSDDFFELQDVASKNGTFLNGVKIAGPTTIRSGDKIKMCEHTIVFHHAPGGDTARNRADFSTYPPTA